MVVCLSEVSKVSCYKGRSAADKQARVVCAYQAQIEHVLLIIPGPLMAVARIEAHLQPLAVCHEHPFLPVKVLPPWCKDLKQLAASTRLSPPPKKYFSV